ncbi:hypothetical protein ACQKP0_23475 [Heyndrickxia sp. NPDC080065]
MGNEFKWLYHKLGEDAYGAFGKIRLYIFNESITTNIFIKFCRYR